jgi:hypothetical protein
MKTYLVEVSCHTYTDTYFYVRADTTAEAYGTAKCMCEERLPDGAFVVRIQELRNMGELSLRPE